MRLNFAGACCGTGFADQPGERCHRDRRRHAANSAREASTKVIEDNATWISGKHSVTFGGTMIQADVWLENQTLVPTVGFGLVSTEPATAMFNAANFPGASAADIAQAQNLYAILTGRITSLTGDARINEAGDKYVPLGKSRAAGRMREFDLYAADSWRATPTLTISAGLRYVLQKPFYPVNNSYTTTTEAGLYGTSGVGNLFKPGTLTGDEERTGAVQGWAPTPTTPTRNNIAPSVGFAWQRQRAERARPVALRIRGRRQRDPRRIRHGVQPPGHVGLHRRVRRQPRHPGASIAPTALAISACCRCCCATRAGDAADRARRRVSDLPAVDRQPERLRREHSAAPTPSRTASAGSAS